MQAETPPTARGLVLAELLASGPTTRVAVSRATGLSSATVTRCVESLLTDGLTEETSLLPASGRGRRAVQLEVNGNHCYAVGVDLGASSTRVVVVDLAGRVIHVHRVATARDLDPPSLGGWLATTIREQLGELEDAARAVAVGLPGAVDPATRTVSNAPHLTQIEQPGFVSAIERELELPVSIDNDANYALLGERYFGVARSTPNAVMFTLGLGLGAGVMIDGRLFRGTHGLVGEFGALPVGPLGTRLEHLVTGFGIMRRAAELGIELASPADLFRPANGALADLRRQFEHGLLVTITAAVVSADPEIVVLGGAIADSLAGSIESIRNQLRSNVRVAPAIELAVLGDLSGALGASVDAIHRIHTGLGVPSASLFRIPGLQAQASVAEIVMSRDITSRPRQDSNLRLTV
jgi:predicted NBD/HSP70 family sugar kinase